MHSVGKVADILLKVKVMAGGRRVTCTEIVSALYLLNPLSDSKNAVKPVLSGHLKEDQKIVFQD